MTSIPQVRNPAVILTVMCAGMFLVLLDVTIVNVALPAIGRGLHTDVASLQWVVDGYVIAIAGLLLAAGTVGDRIGHRRMLLAGFAVFGLASLACALAPAIGVLIAARVVQGVGGALLLPSTMAVIVDVFPDRARQAKALGTWAAVSSLALPAGPLLGGILVDRFGWRPVFWIAVPLTVAATVAARAVVPAAPARRGGRIDVPGLAGFVLGLSALVFAIISAGHHAGTAVVGTAAVVAVGALAGAYGAARRSTHPFLPVDLLRHKEFLAPNVVALMMNLIFNGILFIGMLYLQDTLGRSPVAAGVSVLPLALPLVLLAPVSGRLTARYGPRPAIAIGCALAACGSAMLLTLDGGGSGGLLLSFTVLGCGSGLITTSVVAATVRATPADRSGLATGVSNTARQVGTACGVAIFGAVAGSPTGPGFVGAIHALAIGSALAWVLALLITVFAIEAGGPRTAGAGANSRLTEPARR
ncbi:DHA2 family methylenomycin A resistance protein-like MFS transporter [Nocardia kruczakiae]|uniref:DHA2 family methylenomycin A resistance protein-like MFS transporter n=1 Tax=Nocardia kruczakiae TaxID=261477 RepID=A0ABU1XP52_9NOCA|nr:MFS transporter [Nocardia kruczakiae]MDR7172335.1 DHA2 family methylenomycin A resistance protein-like MFS transporter [Nocardia kruczakiae]